jgi:hypothetical protein
MERDTWGVGVHQQGGVQRRKWWDSVCVLMRRHGALMGVFEGMGVCERDSEH